MVNDEIQFLVPGSACTKKNYRNERVVEIMEQDHALMYNVILVTESGLHPGPHTHVVAKKTRTNKTAKVLRHFKQ